MVALVPSGATAQGTGDSAAGYPTRTVRLIVPYGAGGVSDIIGRVLAQKLSDQLGQPVVVENRGGAGGMLGTGQVAKSPPDGYTLVLSSLSAYAIGPRLVRTPPYDPVKDFTAIAGVALTPTILTVNPALAQRTVKEIVDYAKANPGRLNYGSSGVGSIGHISAELLRAATGAELVHIPYKSAAFAYPDLISGSVTMVFDALPSAIQYIRSGKVRPVAMMSEQRSPLLPDVPTFAEAGFPRVTLRLWVGLHGPSGLPPAIVQRLNEATAKALAAPELRERFASVGADPMPLSAQAFGTMVREDVAALAKTIEVAGIKPD
jgi:tripartite-type tricarboxylate transporter receptor subunit TctC